MLQESLSRPRLEVSQRQSLEFCFEMQDKTNVFTDLPGVVTRHSAVTGTRTVTRAWSA